MAKKTKIWPRFDQLLQTMVSQPVPSEKLAKAVRARQRSILILTIGLTLLNLTVLAVQMTSRARAEVAGKDWFELAKDDDFRQAVGYVVSKCTIDTDRGPPKILCGR